MNPSLSWNRLFAMVTKEFVQMRRDRFTFAMMIGIPLLQLTIFGLAINMNPRHLPTAILCADNSVFSRSILQAVATTDYFALLRIAKTEAELDDLLRLGTVQFGIQIPEDFSRRLLRGEHPEILVQADATDPAATGNAVAALQELAGTAIDHDLKGPLARLRVSDRPPFGVILHRKYNPEIITQNNIVPGLLGVVLTMTMVMITTLAITREVERGTMENLLATPIRPLEVMVGKIVPYILVGYIQTGLILAVARFFFHVPARGSLALLLAAMFLFIVANLAVGITFSTVGRNQLQAVQMSFFFFLPSILLSGFMFPFRGMPEWAQGIGEVLPLTHFLRIVRGILLKGNGLAEIIPDLWPIALFLTVMMTVGVKRYRQTLD